MSWVGAVRRHRLLSHTHKVVPHLHSDASIFYLLKCMMSLLLRRMIVYIYYETEIWQTKGNKKDSYR